MDTLCVESLPGGYGCVYWAQRVTSDVPEDLVLKIQVDSGVARSEFDCAAALRARYMERCWDIGCEWFVPTEMHFSREGPVLLAMPTCCPSLNVVEFAQLVEETCSSRQRVAGGRGHACEEACLYYVSEVLRLLGRLHSVGLIHGDVRPENFLMVVSPVGGTGFSVGGFIDDGGTSDLEKSKRQGVAVVGIDLGLAVDALSSAGAVLVRKREMGPTFFGDLRGVVEVLHVLLFHQRVSLRRSRERLTLDRSLQGHRYQPLWEEVFDSLLNLSLCVESSAPSVQLLEHLHNVIVEQLSCAHVRRRLEATTQRHARLLKLKGNSIRVD